MLYARKTCLVLCLALLVCGGCAKRRTANIVRYPEWQFQDYHRIAVLTFQINQPPAAEAARQAELALIDDLAGNGAFEVLTRTDLKDVLTEQDLARLADVADPATAMPEGKIQVAQALIIARITDFDLRQEQAERRRPRYARDRAGRVVVDRAGRPIVTGEDVFVEYRHVARLGGNVRVIDSATGRLLLSESVPPLEKDDAQWNAPPRATPEELAVDLAKELATEFYRRIAPQQISLKLDGDCLILAAGYYEGRYDELKNVPTNLPEILLVARDLPKECDRNQFRLAISPADERGYLVEHEFTWSPAQGRRGEAVPVPMEKLTSAGGEKFVAKLFAVGNEQPILQREFKLEQPKEEKAAKPSKAKKDK
jgi:hypothetical protein